MAPLCSVFRRFLKSQQLKYTPERADILGAIIEFVKSSSEPLELMINNKVIAHGETVKVGENFGLRITRIGDPKAIMKAVSGR